MSVKIGNREIVAFGELSKYGSNRILAIYPIAADSSQGWSWAGDSEGSLNVWGVESDRGQRIAEAYQTGKLPSQDRDEVNRVLRPEESEG
jgi:hypothetical protein